MADALQQQPARKVVLLAVDASEQAEEAFHCKSKVLLVYHIIINNGHRYQDPALHGPEFHSSA